jgi:uncharacterized protein (TIGR00299 family) protein
MLTAYFDCFSGISGDMTLGALVDLGVPVDWLEAQIRDLPLDGFKLSAAQTVKGGIRAVDIVVAEQDDHAHRNYGTIKHLIANSGLNDRVKSLSLEMFLRIGQAEARIHGCQLDQVHFHEVGGVDAIVDMVGTALAIDYLGIEKVMSARIPVGGGVTTCSHGTLPVPAPATVEILKGVPVSGGGESELTTPTGAAIIRVLADDFGPLPPMTIRKTGYGAGKREISGRPNLLRILLGETGAGADELLHDTVLVVEANIDDMNPEICGYLLEKLLTAGALDVVFIPVFMKKSRPGLLLQVLVRHEDSDKINREILSETSSIGLRYYPAQRQILPRQVVDVETVWGRLAAKKVQRPGGKTELVPEYEVCRKVAEKHGIPLREVYDTLTKNM